MIAPYRRLLRTPGAVRFSIAGLVARMPIAMTGIATVILVQRTTGSYGTAGAVAGTIGVANAVASPLVARAVDKLGQGRVLPPVVLLQAAGLIALLCACVLDAPRWTLFAIALVVGSAAASIGPLIRARWAFVLHQRRSPDPADLHTAYSLESVLDEVVFILGPVLVTTLALAYAGAGLALAAVLLLGGGLWLATQSATTPPVREVDAAGPRGRLPLVDIGLVTLALTGAGAVFGSAEVVVVAFTTERGVPGAAGALLAMWALGSLVAGLAYGARRWRSSLAWRFLVAAGLFAVGPVLLALAPNIYVLGACMLVAGAGISPMIIAAFGLIERRLPADRLTEGLTWATTGLLVSFAGAAALTGRIIDSHGARPAFAVTVASGLLTGLLVAAGYRHLAAGEPRLTESPGVSVPDALVTARTRTE